MRDAIPWLVLLMGFAAPLLHVALSPRSGPWLPRLARAARSGRGPGGSSSR